jgi:hypothetical protein
VWSTVHHRSVGLSLLVLLLVLVACPVLHHGHVAFLVGTHILRNHLHKTQILMKRDVFNKSKIHICMEIHRLLAACRCGNVAQAYLHVLPSMQMLISSLRLANADVALLGVPI